MNNPTTLLPAHIDRRSWGGLFTDVGLWRPVITRILQKHGLGQGKRIEAGYPGSCAVFIVDQEVVVKVFPPMFAGDFQREKAVYETITGHVSPIPRLMSAGVYRDRIDWPYLILSFCPGRPLRDLGHLLSQEDKQRIGAQLGRLISDLHSGPMPVGMDQSWLGWRRFLRGNSQRSLDYLRRAGTFSSSLIRQSEQFLERKGEIWLQERPLCLINADLTEDHLLLVQESHGWRIAAVIDWADARAGVPDYEWVALWHGLCGHDPYLFESTLAACNKGLKFDMALQERLLLYTFMHQFGGPIIEHLWREKGRPHIDAWHDLQALLLNVAD